MAGQAPLQGSKLWPIYGHYHRDDEAMDQPMDRGVFFKLSSLDHPYWVLDVFGCFWMCLDGSGCFLMLLDVDW